MLIPGIVSATFKKLAPEQVISLVRESHLQAIEWSENHHIEKGNVLQSEKVGELTRAAGLEVASYGSYYRLGLGMDFLPSLESAKAMKAPLIRIWAGDRPSSEVSSSERKEMVKEAKQLSHLAQQEGIVVCTEWHKNTLTDTNESALRLFEEVSSPCFHTFWQPTQALSFSERLEGLSKAEPLVENLHVYYWDESGRRPLAEGEEHWKKYLSLLGLGNHYVLLEFVKDDSIEQFKEDAKTLLNWLKGEKNG